MKIKLVYKDELGFISEMVIDVPESENENIDQCLNNLYGWTVEN